MTFPNLLLHLKIIKYVSAAQIYLFCFGFFYFRIWELYGVAILGILAATYWLFFEKEEPSISNRTPLTLC